MSARILDGAAVAGDIRRELSARAEEFTRRAGRQPGLSIVLVGDKPDSQIYVNSKLKSAGDEGMRATLSHLPASATLDEIVSLVDTLNAEPATEGAAKRNQAWIMSLQTRVGRLRSRVIQKRSRNISTLCPA